MSSTPTPFPPPTPPTPPPTPAPTLCHGLGIEYKAFVRSFTSDKKVGTLCLMATCSYVTSGFTIYFEEDSGKMKLMEQPPSGVFLNLVTYYSASWPAKGTPGQSKIPKQVTITDAYGDHKLHVKEWE
jgi:hypothetical protein